VKTFVVRLWVAEEGEAPAAPGLHGTLEHAGSAHSTAFAGEEQLLELLLAGVTAERATGDGDPRD
jgi:hypothetical protein